MLWKGSLPLIAYVYVTLRRILIRISKSYYYVFSEGGSAGMKHALS